MPVGALVVGGALASWLSRLPRGDGAAAIDLEIYHYPTFEAAYARLGAGVVPTWNSHQLCGVPSLAALQGGFFYPLHVLYLFLPLRWALAASHGLHIALAALFMLTLARRAGCSTPAAVLATMLFVLRGMFPMALPHPNVVEAVTWLPLAALGVLDLARGDGIRGTMLVATAVGASLLAGYPQVTVYVIYLLPTLLIAALLAERAPRGRWIAGGAALGAALALAACAAAVQLLPSLELVREGAHRNLSPQAMALSLSPAAAFLASSVIAGGPFSLGVTALALAVAAPLNARARVLALWAVIMTGLTVLLALGPATPLFRLYRLLPLLDAFRFPDRALFLTDFVVALAAAFGLDAVSGSAGAAARARLAGLVALGAAAGLVVLSRSWGASGEARPAVVAGGLATAALILFATAAGGRRATLVGAVLLLVAAAELQLTPWRHARMYAADLPSRWGALAADYRALAARAGGARVWISNGVMALRPEHAVKLATRYGLRTIDDYEPLLPRRQAQYLTFFTEGTVDYHRPPWLSNGQIVTLDPPAEARPAAARRRLLDLAAVRFLVVPGPLHMRPDVAAFIRDAGLVPGPPAGSLPVFENPHALPRAFVVYRTRPAPDPAALLATISDAAFDPLAESWVEGDTLTSAVAEEPPRGAPASIVVDDDAAVEVDATLERPGLVVLADAYFPGWRATVDGADATVLPTNHLFRGVAAPAGTHRVRFEYRPASVRAGAIASLVGWLAIAVLAVRARASRPRRDARAPAPGSA